MNINLNCFLQTRREVDECTTFLKDNGFVFHAMICKNWDIAKIIPHIGDGNVLDMGSAGSFILENTLKKGCVGLKYGIDISYPEGHKSPIEGIGLIRGDLMNTPFMDDTFDYVTCLSVIEHEVDYFMLSVECNRIMRKGGKLFITFDYWNPKVDTTDVGTALYGLKWTILDKSDVLELIKQLENNGFVMSDEMDWTIQDRVINDHFYAPYGKAYTFGIITVIKK